MPMNVIESEGYYLKTGLFLYRWRKQSGEVTAIREGWNIQPEGSTFVLANRTELTFEDFKAMCIDWES